MSSTVRFPENRRLDGKIDSFLIGPALRNDVCHNLYRFSQFNTADLQELVLPSINDVVDGSEMKWSQKSLLLKHELLRQIKVSKIHLEVKERYLEQQKTSLKKLIKYAKVSPLMASEVLQDGVKDKTHQWIWRKKLMCVAFDEGKRCHSIAIPYSKYCIQHVLTDKKQVLYKRCIAIDSTSLRQCHKPVLEILQDKPYCRTHATTFLEVKKTTSKLNPSTAKSKGKRKISPGRQKAKVTEVKKVIIKPSSLPLQPPPPTEPLLTQSSIHTQLPTLPVLSSSSWSSAESEGEEKRARVDSIGVGPLLPMTPTLPNLTKDMPLVLTPNEHKSSNDDSLLPFSTNSVNSLLCPTLAPPVVLLPPDATLHGNILDDSSSGDE